MSQKGAEVSPQGIMPKPLGDPLRTLGVALGVISRILCVVVVLGFVGIYFMIPEESRGDVANMVFIWFMMFGSVMAVIPILAFLRRILPRRRTEAIFLRSFRNDPETWRLRTAVQDALGPDLRLSGIRDPRRRWPLPLRIVLLFFFALRYSTPRYMNLEAGPDWKARLWRSLGDARCAFIDVTEITPFVAEEIDLCYQSLGSQRVLFLDSGERPLHELRAQIRASITIPEVEEDRIQVVRWSARRGPARAEFRAAVERFAAALPKEPAGLAVHARHLVDSVSKLDSQSRARDAFFWFQLVAYLVAFNVLVFFAGRLINQIPDRSAWPYIVVACINMFILLQLVFYIMEVGLRRCRRLAGAFSVYLVFLTAASGLLLVAVDAAREAARRMMCSNNIKIIELELMNYYSTNNSLPPAYLADETGRPYHSWRILILPGLLEMETEGSPEFKAYRAILDDYRFDEPWDSPHNLEVGQRHPIPRYFHCPDSEGPGTRAAYFMIVGPGYVAEPLSPAESLAAGPYALPKGTKAGDGTKKLYPGTRLLGRRDIPDGDSHTINLVECDSIGSSWLEPTDLALDGSVSGVRKLLECSRRHPGGLNVGWCDGGSFFLRSNMPAERVQACLTRAGGELASRDALEMSER